MVLPFLGLAQDHGQQGHPDVQARIPSGGNRPPAGSSSKSMLISLTRGRGCMTIISFLAAFITSGVMTNALLTFS